MTDQTTDRHTCHNQKAAAGPAWQCPRCSATPAVPLPPVVQSPIREQLLNAIDFSYCQTLGFGTPEELLAAYEASRTQTVDEAALRATAEAVLAAVETALCDELVPAARAEALARIAAVLPAATNHDTDTGGELTAEQARALADDLGLQLYRAQDALAFVGECCTIAEREQRAITTADVREWLKGAQCGRQLAADAELRRVADETAATETQAATGPCTNCRGSGLDPRYNGDFACPDCQPAPEPAAGARQDGAQA